MQVARTIVTVSSLTCVCLLASAAWAQDTVILEIDPGDRVSGTLRPASEVERFVLELPAGAVLTAAAKSKGGPILKLTLIDPGGSEVARGATRGKRVTLVAPIETSGVYVIRVVGDRVADGDYVLKAKSKPTLRFRARSETDLAAEATADVAFAAPAGARLTATVGPARKSDLVPADVVLIGPDGAVDVGAQTNARGKVKVTADALPATGDYVLRFANAGADGSWKVRIDVTPSAPAKRRIDVTDAALQGTFGGTQAVFGARATPDTATAIVPAEGALNLAAMQLTVPAGAVTQATVVSIAQIEPFFVDDTTFAAGEAVRLEPAGLTFEDEVEVTLPFLAQSYDDPLTELVVVRRDEESGEIEELPGPYDIDVDAGVVTFPTSTFSSFQTVSRSDRPVKGTFLEIVIRPRLDDDGGALTLATNLVHGDFGERTINPADRARVAHTLTWSRAAGVAVVRDETAEVGTFQLASDAEVVLATPSSWRTYRRGRTPNALVAAGSEDGGPRLGVLLRRTAGTPTRGALAGDWHVFVLEANATEIEPGSVTARLVVQRLALRVANDGTSTARSVVRVVGIRDLANVEWSSVGDRDVPADGTLEPATATGDEAFGAILDMELGLRRFLTRVELLPALSGDVLIGTAGAQKDGAGAVRLVVLVRQSTAAANRDLAGDSILGAIGFRVGGAPGAELADATIVRDLDVLRTAKGAVTGTGEFIRQDRGAPTISIPESFSATWKLKATGALREFQPMRDGALTPRGELYIDTDVRDGRFEIGFGLPAPIR